MNCCPPAANTWLQGGNSLISTVKLRLEEEHEDLVHCPLGRNFPDQYGGIATQPDLVPIQVFRRVRWNFPDQYGGIATPPSAP
jgi:hypothetical protein